MEVLSQPEPSKVLSVELNAGDQIVTDLPRWLVRHICKPENRRLAGKFKPGYFTQYNSSYAHSDSWMRGSSRVWNEQRRCWEDAPDRRLPVHYHGTHADRPDPVRALIAHLDQNDYRLWAEVRWPMRESMSNLIMARCRWCHERFPLREFAQVKKTHKLTCNFTHNLREVFTICLQMGQCVACARHTRKQRWGLPLCDVNCQRTWMFATDHSDQLAHAVIKARLAKKITENLRIIHAAFEDITIPSD